MRGPSTVSISALLIAGVLTIGCGTESPSAPLSPSLAASPGPGGSGGSGKLSKPVKMEPLKREHSLSGNVSASVVIGPWGGVISLPEAGFTLVVPAMAVTQNTTFKVIAKSGSAVAYDFEPAGSQFRVPLIGIQNLSVTQAKHGGPIPTSALSVGYFPDPTQIATVTELLNLNIDLFSQAAVFPIWHFSGYMFASGRSMANEEF